jgi:hypothetical protein
MGIRSCFLLLLIQTQFRQTGKKQDLTPLLTRLGLDKYGGE